MKNNVLLNIFKKIGFWFPILLSMVIYGKHLDVNIVFGNIILALLLILVCNVFSNTKVYKAVEIISVVAFNIIMFFQIAHFHLFNDNIKPSTLFIIFDTNSSETTDFLSMYLDVTIVFVLVSLIIVSLLSIILKNKKSNGKTRLIFTVFAVLIIGVLLSSFKTRKYIFPNIVYKAVNDYQLQKKRFKEITYDKFGGEFTDVQHLNDINDEVYVLVIGESTTKTHMQLYDYYRNTNPLLNSIKEELVVYNDVIPPNTHTIPSLEKTLTLGSTETPDNKFNGTLIQLFNKAGFNTYWISNQKPMGMHETMTTIISKNCDEQYFVNTSGYGHQSLDEKVLKPLKNVLKQDQKKKFIVVHIMGNHVIYSNRYPDAYNKFNDIPKTKFKHEKAYEMINTYDNAILYNDFVISEIINEVKLANAKSYVLYFSDHGEDVYETMDKAGHNETKGSKPMYEIPFVFWSSEKFNVNKEKFIFDTDRKASTEDLLFTLSDLSNITFKEFDSSKSLVNEKFIEKKRLLSNQIDYDTHFNAEKE